MSYALIIGVKLLDILKDVLGEGSFTHDPIANADSIWNRGGLSKTFSGKQAGGKDIERIMNFDRDASREAADPVTMMDIVTKQDRMYYDEDEEENKRRKWLKST